MQQYSIILAPNYLVSIQAGEDNHFSVWLRRIPPLVFWHCKAPRCGISKFISFTTEPNEGNWWCKHRRGAAKTDLEPMSITTERDGEPRKRFLILNSPYSSTTANTKPRLQPFPTEGKVRKALITHQPSLTTATCSPATLWTRRFTKSKPKNQAWKPAKTFSCLYLQPSNWEEIEKEILKIIYLRDIYF